MEQAKSLALEDITAIVTSHPSVRYIFEVGVEVSHVGGHGLVIAWDRLYLPSGR